MESSNTYDAVNDYVRGIFGKLGIEEREFLEELVVDRTYIRVNTLKVSLSRFLKNTELELSKTGYKYGYRVEGDVKIGKTMEYFLGYLHTQSLSSMMPVLAFSSWKDNIEVLDAAASPGGKTSQIAQHTSNKAAITAIDKRTGRISLLVSNLERLGVVSVNVVRRDSRKLPWKNTFNKVLVDAPCSSLGSSLFALRKTTHRRVRDMARVQRKMLLSAFDALKEGGELVYSTCTITEEENEAVVANLLENRSNATIERVKLPIRHSKGLESYEFSDKVARIYPWEVESEAFFVARIKKS
ncbi:MAG: RsmB/NOP family class I SAM-dependent RNA methyltransferase [Methanobacteriota archaeon]|nr:MAG: RsmB/NOP family class I SAM-dependent RNA methyltransferase [Euryarchaeota archaeon]